MTARVHLGSEFTIARNGFTHFGRLLLSSGSWWTENTGASPGFDWSPTAEAANTATLATIMEWLTGKVTGASVLICAVDPVPTGYPFASEWQNALTTMGHTFTLSGAVHFNGLDPLDYDCVHIINVSPVGDFADEFDAYLDERGAAFSFCNVSFNSWARYGVNAPGPSQTYVGPPDYLMSYPSLLGVSRQVLQFTNSIVAANGAGTRGGTTTIYDNVYSQGGFASWVQV